MSDFSFLFFSVSLSSCAYYYLQELQPLDSPILISNFLDEEILTLANLHVCMPLMCVMVVPPYSVLPYDRSAEGAK